MHENWMTCDGTGRPSRAYSGNRIEAAMSRRGVLVGVGLGLLGWATQKTALAQLAINPTRKNQNVLVVIFLRGGADGISLVAPYAEDTYYRLRPTTAIRESEVYKLSDRFGLHPKLAPLQQAWEDKRLGIIHAVGSNDQSRSHFEAMDTMERGSDRGEGASSGWLARYLTETEQDGDSPLRAVALSYTMPTSLVGATHAIAVESLTDFRLASEPGFEETLKRLYTQGKDEVSKAGQETLTVLKALQDLDPAAYQPSHGATYPDTAFGNALRQVACLIKEDVGVEIASVDMGGWDTHVAQGTAAVGWLPTLLDELGGALGGFYRDLVGDLGRVTVVVQTEFGRRLAENTGLGTDHGSGSCMFLIGAGVQGGKIVADWPGLESLVGPGDLAVTTDYRHVLSDVLQRRMRPHDTAQVFTRSFESPLGVIA